MTKRLILIAHPLRPAVDAELISKVQEHTATHYINVLADGIATEFMCEAPDDDQLEALIGDRPVDWVIRPSDTPQKSKLLLADMDSTMIDQECIDELADFAGLKERVSAITARAMNGEIAFEPALRERVALLKGLPTDVIGQVIKERITLASGGRELVATMNANGATTALVSGGFTAFTSRIAAMLGFQENRANTLIADNGVLTGEVGEPIVGQQAKVDALNELQARLGINRTETLAVGDGANDLGMIKLAGMGVALHAKPSVAAQAPIRINHGDLTALLYLQGYRRSDFVNQSEGSES